VIDAGDRETFVERELKESLTDRNERAIRRAVVWYAQHLAGKSVVLITGSQQVKAKALDDGLNCLMRNAFLLKSFIV
jgi:hypothetical protein